MAIDNCQYFIKDCASCKYCIASDGCLLTAAHYNCMDCPNSDASSKSVYGTCNCVKDADKTLEHCPYWRDLDD